MKFSTGFNNQNHLFRLRRAPVTVKFVTNTTKECKRILYERLRQLNFDLQQQEIFTSLTAARNLLEQRAVRPLLLVEDGALEDFTGELNTLFCGYFEQII